MHDAVTELDRLPTRNGFRLRGQEMTRIETFTDAAFAFALTLLVVSFDIPTSYVELVAALRGVPAFALSAVMLMMFWFGHHTWSRRYGLDDGPAMVLSALLVFTVLVYVYPLKFLARVMTAWLNLVIGVPIPTQPIMVTGAEVNRLFAIYGTGFIAMCLGLVLLNVHAWRRRDDLRLDAIERHDTRAEIGAWSLLALVGAFSVVIALAFPDPIGLPGWVYMSLAVIMPVYGSLMSRRRPSPGRRASPTSRTTSADTTVSA